MSKRVDDIMTRSLHFIDVKASIQQAHEEMVRHTIRHMLVTETPQGRLVGILSDRDVKKYVSPFATAASATDRDKATLAIEVGKVMTKSLVTAKPGDRLNGVVEMMLQKGISGVPIVGTDGKAVGIVTSTDLIKLLLTYL